MKTMIFSDLVTMKNSFTQLIGIEIVIGIFMFAVTQSVTVCVAAVAAASPFMYLFSISAYDEMNSWESFRLTLPLTRRQVVIGRYASMLIVSAFCLVLAFAIGVICTAAATAIGSVIDIPESMFFGETTFLDAFKAASLAVSIMIVAASVSFPPIIRFGMSKGTRLVPVIIVILLAAAIVVGDTTMIFDGWEEWLRSTAGFMPAIIVIVLIAVIALLYVLSAFISIRLYEHRQL